MKIKSILTLLLNTITNISINYYDILLNNRDYLFKLKFLILLDKNKEVSIHVIDIFVIFIQIKNFIEIFIILFENIRLDTIIKFIIDKYY